MLDSSTLKEALQSKSLTRFTKAVNEAAKGLAFQLKPPYTEILEFKAREQAGRFHIQFAARLHLHYASLRTKGEGLVFTIKFNGEALSDSPGPSIDQLFYAAVVRSLQISGYGSRWAGGNAR